MRTVSNEDDNGMPPGVLRYAAFTADPATGNPAGIVLDATGMADSERQAIAAAVGYSETAFAEPLGDGEFALRYFSPAREVPFCGHATLATAVALAALHGAGRITFHTPVGEVVVTTTDGEGGVLARIDAPTGHSRPAAPEQLERLLAALRWSRDDLDESLPPHVANAGNDHFVLAAGTRERLAALAYDFDTLLRLMQDEDWITIQLVWMQAPDRYHSRNPFPVGGVVEDPATGAAAAAFGYYLHALGKVPASRTITIIQGGDMGRRSVIEVDVDEGPRVAVRGTAVRIDPR